MTLHPMWSISAKHCVCTSLEAWLERPQLVNNTLASTLSWSQTTGAQDVFPRNRLKCRLFLMSFLLNANTHMLAGAHTNTHTHLMYFCTQADNDSSRCLLSCFGSAGLLFSLPLTLFHPSVLYTALLVQEYMVAGRGGARL